MLGIVTELGINCQSTSVIIVRRTSSAVSFMTQRKYSHCPNGTRVSGSEKS